MGTDFLAEFGLVTMNAAEFDAFNVDSRFGYLHSLYGNSNMYNMDYALIQSSIVSLVGDYLLEYNKFGLESINAGFFDTITNAVDFRFSLDFFNWGVRDDYGELPVFIRFVLGSLLDSNYQFGPLQSTYLDVLGI
ncbi:MAG: hypothetical protein IH840_07025 [Candidatus Heimdallarchaeota archaeon]|nr:hypothetical protein [Candidatus Heimdallarchaeota archaeon]